eukprot:gene9056-11094_t
MDSFVNDCLNTSSPARTLNSTLSKYEDLLERNHQSLDQVLNTLDPRLNSLGYLYVLKAKISDTHKNAQTFISQTQNFLMNCSPDQIRPAVIIIPIRGVNYLRRAICVIQERASQLTPIHADFLQLCILSKSYSIALPIIEDQNITELNPDYTHINIKDVLCYFYYAGIIFTTLKKYKHALESFKMVFTAPATAISAIAIEAYKKYLVIHLIQNGQSPNFPRYTPNIIQRNIKVHCKAYTDLSVAFTSNNMTELQTKIAMNSEAFTKDHNLGLVKLSLKAMYRRNIKKLTQTYMTLSIRDIAEHVKLSPRDAELYVLKMIEEGEIFATINQKDGMVSFHENPESYNGTNIMSELENRIDNIVKMESKLKSADDHLALSQSYLKRLVNNDRRSVMPFDSEQGRLTPTSQGRIKIDQIENSFHSLSGLNEFSHVWLLFWFHSNYKNSNNTETETIENNNSNDNNKSNKTVKVRPPKLNGKRIGVFATRTPHRPVPIGMTLCKLERVDTSTSTVYLSGIDIIDGTPILDIKPYIPMYDSIQDSMVPDWVNDVGNSSEIKQVEFTEESISGIYHCLNTVGLNVLKSKSTIEEDVEKIKNLITEVLLNEPRSIYRRTKRPFEKWGFYIDTLNIQCQVKSPGIATILVVEDKSNFMYKDKELENIKEDEEGEGEGEERVV